MGKWVRLYLNRNETAILLVKTEISQSDNIMKYLFPFCVIILLGSVCFSEITQPDCQGNTTSGGYSSCRPRCDNLHNPPKSCPPFLLLGCTCKNGYIPVNSSYNPLKCVKQEDCPK